MEKEEFKEIPWTMTSGSLTSLKAYTDVGGFDDDLFIAHIDIDFCIRLKQDNWKILMVGPAVIKQRFGNSKPVRILWKKFTHHLLVLCEHIIYSEIRNI